MATNTSIGLISELGVMVLMLMRLAVFGLSLGLTVISFQSYRQRPAERLESAFIGFAFLSIGVALTTLRPQAQSYFVLFQLVETIPFIIGFGMLYRSLYK